MKKTQVQVRYGFWAKKFDTHAHIATVKPYGVLCGKYGALLGNNYAEYLYDVCPECLKRLQSTFDTSKYEYSVKVDIKEFEEKEVDHVDFYGNPEYSDHGIGSYEYWGAKCRDVDMQWDCEDVTWDESLYTAEENAIIENYIEEAVEKLLEHVKKS
jgi:hypothetical protein